MAAPQWGVDHDKVKPSLDFNATVANSGTTTPFGATTWSTFNMSGITVTKQKDSYKVSHKVDNPITYAVDSPKTSIASAADAALTAANYKTAATDLTPRMDVQNGKPLRSQFWARDLTLRHEKFHSKERSRLNKAGAKQAQSWLGTQTAASVAEVQQHVAQVPAKITAASQAAVGTLDEKESRAYGDGASSYKSRAKAIKKAGDKGNNRDSVLEQLFATKNRKSVLGTYSMDSTGDSSITDYGAYKIKDGKLVYYKTIKAQK
jgi:hypothetical protein